MTELKAIVATNLNIHLEKIGRTRMWLAQRTGISQESINSLLDTEGSIDLHNLKTVATFLRFEHAFKLFDPNLKPPLSLEEIEQLSFENIDIGNDPEVAKVIKLMSKFLDIATRLYTLSQINHSPKEVKHNLKQIAPLTEDNPAEGIFNYLLGEGLLLMSPVQSERYDGLLTKHNSRFYMHLNSSRDSAELTRTLISLYLKMVTSLDETFIAYDGTFELDKETENLVRHLVSKSAELPYPAHASGGTRKYLDNAEIAEYLNDNDLEYIEGFLVELNMCR